MRAYTDEEILDHIRTYMRGSENPDLVGYRQQTLERDFSNTQRYMWFMKYICNLGDFKEKRLLDVGCGCGWQALTISLLGNNHVVAMDILPSMIDAVTDCVQHLHRQNVNFDVVPRLGDICNANMDHNSFDAIYSIEAIEHVHDLDQMFDNCSKLLKVGGKLTIANDCNILHRRVRNANLEMWYKRDRSWEFSDYLKNLRPIEHKDAKPYAAVREEIIKAANPRLSQESINLIVDATAGLVRKDIEEIAKNYKASNYLPKVPEFDWCRNPLTGEYAERLLNPFKIADSLRDRGFSVRVLHAFRRFPLNLSNSIQFQPLNTLLFNVRPLFVVVGEKTAASASHL